MYSVDAEANAHSMCMCTATPDARLSYAHSSIKCGCDQTTCDCRLQEITSAQQPCRLQQQRTPHPYVVQGAYLLNCMYLGSEDPSDSESDSESSRTLLLSQEAGGPSMQHGGCNKDTKPPVEVTITNSAASTCQFKVLSLP